MQSCAFNSEARYRRRRRTCHGRDLLLLRRCRRPGTHSQYSSLQRRCIVNALGQWLSRMSVIVPNKSLSLSLSLSLIFTIQIYYTHLLCSTYYTNVVGHWLSRMSVKYYTNLLYNFTIQHLLYKYSRALTFQNVCTDTNSQKSSLQCLYIVNIYPLCSKFTRALTYQHVSPPPHPPPPLRSRRLMPGSCTCLWTWMCGW